MSGALRRLHLAASKFSWRYSILRKWWSIVYVVRTKGFGFAETRRMWDRSVREWGPAQATRGPLGFERDQTSLFFEMVAHEGYERAEQYRCVEGCCVVIWSNGRNDGGYGPAGCPCDQLKDPRGEKIDA